MNFGDAIEELKNGQKLARHGWIYKGIWIVLMQVDSQPCIAMWTSQKKWQPGWFASQADILAEDWQIVE